jgi:hypothetical protein
VLEFGRRCWIWNSPSVHGVAVEVNVISVPLGPIIQPFAAPGCVGDGVTPTDVQRADGNSLYEKPVYHSYSASEPSARAQIWN